VPVTGADVLRVAGLNRRSTRLAAAEALAASEGGPITERALRDLRATQAVEHRHLGSDTVGEAVFLDTMYIGNLKVSEKSGSTPVWTTRAASASPAPGPERSPRRRWPISPNMTSGPPTGRSASSSSRS
jgi:hypothetical protein